MIKLNDYLYSGDTVLKILQKYASDLGQNGRATHNDVDLMHADFLNGITSLLEHNEFLTSQSQRIREFYKYMASAYPFLAFTFKGRIKSLIRSEEKFNGYIVETIYDRFAADGTLPDQSALQNQLEHFRDLIAYRIVISMPACHLKDTKNRDQVERRYLYEIANALPEFLESRGFSAEPSRVPMVHVSPLLKESVRPYYRDYVANPTDVGYQSLHVTFYDNIAENYVEIQIRTKKMDDYAEIGQANHTNYEKSQERDRARREAIPEGKSLYFDEAYERVMALQDLDLSKIDVNMFAAADNHLINDGCGLYRGRLILPYEHLSRFQNDRID